MKRVYRVDFDLTDFGLLAVDGELSDYLDLLTLDGTSKADVWVPPPVFAPYPRRRRPDLWHLLGAQLWSVVATSPGCWSRTSRRLARCCRYPSRMTS